MWFALIVAVVSLVGAAIPLRTRPSHAQVQVYLSLAAGALLGAAMFHMLPESSHYIGATFGIPATLGILCVFLIQRYVAPHSHEPGQSHAHEHLPAEQAAHEHADHDARHHHDHDQHCHQHSGGAGSEMAVASSAAEDNHAAPLLSGLVGILALAVHSLFDGITIGAASVASGDGGALALSVFFSVLIHKPLDGLSVSVLLLNAGTKRSTLWVIQVLYAMLAPVGALLFITMRGVLTDAGPIIGYTLAFSGGTFLSIALTDLLPELQFHKHDRNKLTFAMVLGMVVMFATSLIGHDEHTHGGAPATTPSAQDHDHSHDDHDHDH